MFFRVHRLSVASLASALLLSLFLGLLPANLSADAPSTTMPAATQPTLTAYTAKPDAFPLGGGKSMIVLGQVGIPLPKGLVPLTLTIDSVSEFGFMPRDQSIFYGVQIYSCSGSVDSLTDQDLAPPAIAELHKRWASVVAADAPVEVQHTPTVLLKLGYSAHLCHGAMHMVDRYAKLGKDLMRITVIPMSETLTAEQFADISAKADVTVDQLIESARPFDEQAAKRQALAALRARMMASTPSAAASNDPPRSAPASLASPKSSNASPLDVMNHRAQLALAQADKLKAAGKDADAYERYKFVAKQYARTPSADPANKAVAAYESDTDFMAKYNGATPQPTASDSTPSQSAAAKADSLLSLADSYAAAGQPDLAREKYQSVIDQFPGTPAAAKAKQKLAGT